MTRHVRLELRGAIAVLTLCRPTQRNAIDEALLEDLDRAMDEVPATTRALVLAAEGPHFCAGLDLKEHHDKARSAVDFMRVCQHWHRSFDRLQYGGVAVIAALQGAVVGGGLELAAAAHIRIADESTYFALPESTKGIFTGGGATVRVARIITPGRMVEMMLTGRVLDARAGLALGLAHELCPSGKSLQAALEIAGRVAGNAALSNYAVVSSIARIADMSASDGMFAESLMAAVVQTGPEVQPRLKTFVDKTLPRVAPTSVGQESSGA
jgi:(methylthio)acryloyl-CoA hydratase